MVHIAHIYTWGKTFIHRKYKHKNHIKQDGCLIITSRVVLWPHTDVHIYACSRPTPLKHKRLNTSSSQLWGCPVFRECLQSPLLYLFICLFVISSNYVRTEYSVRLLFSREFQVILLFTWTHGHIVLVENRLQLEW